MSECLEMDFATSNAGKPILVKWRLSGPGFALTAGGGETNRAFSWGRPGPRVLALALVRLARWRGTGDGTDEIPVLAGNGRPSEAATLGDAVMKTGAIYWPAVLLSPANPPDPYEATGRLRSWFRFQNVQGKRQGEEMRVFAIRSALPPESVTIRWDGSEATGERLDRLERAISAGLHGSLPPFLSGGAPKLLGYLPTTGSVGDCDESLLAAIDDIYSQQDNRILAITGSGGTGKTTIAREWLCRRMMSSGIEQNLVYSWSFYRQGYGSEGGVALSEFFSGLAFSIGVSIEDSMMPAHLASEIMRGMADRSVLLFLDGLEVVQDDNWERNCGIKDAALGAILDALIGGACGNSKVLVTSRRPLKESVRWTFPEVQYLRLHKVRFNRDIGLIARGTEEGGATGTQLEGALARSLQALSGASGGQGNFFDFVDPESDRLPTLVRRILEEMAGSVECGLWLSVGFFDRPVFWDDLIAFVKMSPPLPFLSLFAESSAELLERACFGLGESGLLTLDSEGRVAAHPRVAECLSAEVEMAFPSAWEAGHRWLAAYFAGQGPTYPDTLREMEPLFRASWHGTQARDLRMTYEEIVFPRLFRGNSGFLLFDLGAYEAGLHMASLLCPDRATFPPGCDLKADDRGLIVHCSALCLRYLDRFGEAHEVEKRAWERVSSDGTIKSIGPIAVHLLRCQHILGNLWESGPVLRRLGRVMAFSSFSSKSLEVPPSFIAVAIGFIGSITATILWCKGHVTFARNVLRFTSGRSIKTDGGGRVLVPGLGSTWHAIALLDMGDWKTVELGIAQGDLEGVPKRNRETGAVQLILGRVLLEKCRVAAELNRMTLAEEAFLVLQEGMSLATQNRLRWWQCAFQLEFSRCCGLLGRKHFAREWAEKCRALAGEIGLRLMEIDATLELIELGEQVDEAEIEARIFEAGYLVRLKRLRSLNKGSPGNREAEN